LEMIPQRSLIPIFVLAICGLGYCWLGSGSGLAKSGNTIPSTPSSIGRSLELSADELATRETILERLEKPVTIADERLPLREYVVRVLKSVEIQADFDEKAISDDGSTNLDEEVLARVEAVSARVALERVFKPHGLAWMLPSGRFVVTTQTESDVLLDVLLYDVTDLVASSKGEAKPWELADIITRHVQPDMWEDVGGVGSIHWLTRPHKVVFVVRQTSELHSRIARVLRTLREFGLSHMPLGEIVELPRPPASPSPTVQGSMCFPRGFMCPPPSSYMNPAGTAAAPPR
jgi:hypothetical protein